VLPPIVQCFTPHTMDFPLTQWSESKFSSAHGWDIYNNTFVIYDYELASHPAIVANYLNGTFLPCPPPFVIERIFNHPYGASRRKLLLSWIRSQSNVHIVSNYHTWFNDPDINILLKRKKIVCTNYKRIGSRCGYSSLLTPLGICTCSQYKCTKLQRVMPGSYIRPLFIVLTAN
jgi:hypothetical protein